MSKKIDWQLKSNGAILIDLKSVPCKYNDDTLEFWEDDIINYIDLTKKRYKRMSKEYTMEIDFPKNIGSFIFPTKENYHFDIESNITISKNKIVLKYNIGDEEKIITINMKED